MTDLYKTNETMELLGHSLVPNNERAAQIDDVIKAYIDNKELLTMNTIITFAVNIFNLGVIYGKRDERKKRNKQLGNRAELMRAVMQIPNDRIDIMEHTQAHIYTILKYAREEQKKSEKVTVKQRAFNSK